MSDTDTTECARCGLPLATAHSQPAGYTRIKLNGDEICGACVDIECDYTRVEDRITLDELEERAAAEAEVRG